MRLLFLRSLVSILGLVVLCSGVYPLAVTVIGQFLFPDEASGSFVKVGGRIIGSKWIAQSFKSPGYFHPRPSAAGSGYDAANSGGSNLGPTNRKLVDRMKADVNDYLKENPGVEKGQVPVEMVTTSASGLDPHISPDSAFSQIKRVATARKSAESEIRALVEKTIDPPQFGLLGGPTLNVLQLNIALDLVKEAP